MRGTPRDAGGARGRAGEMDCSPGARALGGRRPMQSVRAPRSAARRRPRLLSLLFSFGQALRMRLHGRWNSAGGLGRAPPPLSPPHRRRGGRRNPSSSSSESSSSMASSSPSSVGSASAEGPSACVAGRPAAAPSSSSSDSDAANSSPPANEMRRSRFWPVEEGRRRAERGAGAPCTPPGAPA